MSTVKTTFSPTVETCIFGLDFFRSFATCSTCWLMPDLFSIHSDRRASSVLTSETPYCSTSVGVLEKRLVPSPSLFPSIVQPSAASVVGKSSKVVYVLAASGSSTVAAGLI